MIMLKHVVLIISDTNFHTTVKDPEVYQKKLVEFLSNKAENTQIELCSVNGKYCFDKTYGLFDIDDKNKSSFVKTVSDYLSKVDEIIVITNYLHEPYLEPLRNQLKEENKPTTVFNYEVKEKDGQD